MAGPVVWRLQLDDADIASVRYRCLIPVRHLLALGVQSRLSWGRFDPLGGERPAALVFVKSFRDADVAIAERAVAEGIPVLLDVCDNVFSADYAGSAAEGLVRIAAFATAIVTTGPALAAVLRSQLASLPPGGVAANVNIRPVSRHTPRSPPVYEVVDALETADDVRFGERLLWRERARNGRSAGAAVLARTGAEAVWRELPRLRRAAAPAGTALRGRAARRPGGRSAPAPAGWRSEPAPDASAPAPGASAPAPGASAPAPGASAPAPGASAPAPGASAPAPGASAPAPGASAPAPGASAPAPGASAPAPGPSAPAAGDLPQVIWYGNAGSIEPRFGIVNLADIGPQLEAAARRTPFELLVVSSDAEAYRRDIEPLDLPSRYVPWHRRTIAAQIRASAVALVPNSRDDFSICKSANRAVGALHAGVPVVATRTPALEPFAGSVWFDDFEAGVSGYLADRERARADVARARTLIEDAYSGAAVARAWSDVLSAAGIVPGP